MQIWTRNWGGRVLSVRIGYYQSVWARKDWSWESCDSTKQGVGISVASFWLCRMYKLYKTWCDLYLFHHLLFLSNYSRDQFGQIIWNILCLWHYRDGWGSGARSDLMSRCQLETSWRRLRQKIWEKGSRCRERQRGFTIGLIQSSSASSQPEWKGPA